MLQSRPHRATRWAAVAGTTVLAVLATACGGSSQPASGQTGSSKPAVAHSSAASPTTPTPNAAVGQHGIQLLQGGATGQVLSAIDPNTGQAAPTTRVFNDGIATATDSLAMGSAPSFAARQAFNSDFTEMAASSPDPVQVNGSQTAGVIPADGPYSPLTSSSTGFGQVTRKLALGFDPSGKLWYEVPANADTGKAASFGTVDPKVGSSSDKAVTRYTPDTASTSQTFEAVYFLPNGTPVDQAGVADDGEIFLPDGQYVIIGQALAGPNYAMGPDSKAGNPLLGALPAKPSNLPQLWPTLPLTANTFLAMNSSMADPNADTQLYLCTIGKHSVTQRPLLPAGSTWQIVDVVANPSGTTAAFIVSTGATYNMYTISLTQARAQPVQLPDFDPNLGDGARLLAWLP